MNRWQLLYSRAFTLLTISLLVFYSPQMGKCSSQNIRQRSDGCGPHPLIALAAASRSNGVGSLNDVLRAVRADPVVWPVMQNLLRRYDDCIRAADGLHYKRSDESLQSVGYKVYKGHPGAGSGTEAADDFALPNTLPWIPISSPV